MLPNKESASADVILRIYFFLLTAKFSIKYTFMIYTNQDLIQCLSVLNHGRLLCYIYDISIYMPVTVFKY